MSRDHLYSVMIGVGVRVYVDRPLSFCMWHVHCIPRIWRGA